MAEEIVVGSVGVEVVPDARGFAAKVDGQVTPEARALGKKLGEQFGRDIADPIAPAIRRAIREASVGSGSPTIDIDVDAGAAAAELAALQALVERLDAQDADVDVRVDDHGGLGRAASGMSGLLAAALALAPALIPVAAGLAAVAGAAGLLAVIGGGALVALAVGLAPIIKTISALNNADKQSAASAASSAAARVNAAAAVKSATASLANTVANADSAAVRSAEAVKAARQGLTDAQRQAAQAVTRAVREQASAEGALAVAQRAAKQAQADLTQARIDAKRRLEDLAQATKDGALDERNAALAITEARQRLQAVQADPLATSTDRQRAKLDYDQAVQQLDDVTLRNKRLADEKTKADAAGVNGAQNVLDAQQRLADTTRAVADAQTRVADAAIALADARTRGAENVARAERQVVDALRAQKDQARQSAFAIAQAQAALASAQRQQQTAATSASTAAADARRQFEALTPAAQTFVTFLRGTFLPALGQIRDAALDGLLPGFTAGLKALMPIIPDIAEGFGQLAGAVGDLFEDASKALASPFWVEFFDRITDLAGPALGKFGEIFGDIAKGIGGLLLALEPAAKGIGDAVGDIAQKFADWATSAGTGGSLDKFLNFLRDEGPGIARDLADVARAIGDIVVAAAPLGVVVLRTLGDIARVIDRIKPAIRVLAQVIGIAVRTIVDDVAAVAGAFGKIKTAVTDANDWVNRKGDATVAYLRKLPRQITDATRGMFDGIKDAFKSAINWVIDKWNSLEFKLPEVDTHIPGIGKVGGFSLGTPDIPRLALGGIVTSPTLAMVGEGRESEAVLPLSELSRLMQLGQAGLGVGRGVEPTSGMKGRTVIEHFEQKVYNPLPERPSETASRSLDRLQWTLS